MNAQFKTDPKGWVQALAPVVAVLAAGFAWYTTEASEKVVDRHDKEEIAHTKSTDHHNSRDDAHYEYRDNVRGELRTNRESVIKLQGTVERIEEAVIRIERRVSNEGASYIPGHTNTAERVL